jgi:hypothetical protein
MEPDMRTLAGRGRSLWAAALAGCFVAGCASPPAQRLHVGYARVEALVRLHPGYAEVAALDRWQRAATAVASQGLPAIAPPEPRTFEPVGRGALAPPRIAAALDRARQVTDEELARLSAELEARARKQVARRRREAQQKISAEDAARRAGVAAELERGRAQVLLEFRDTVFNLRLRVENLEREMQQTQAPPVLRAQAQQQLEESRRRLNATLAQQSARLDELQKKHDGELAALERAEGERVAQIITGLRQRLEQEREASLARERERLAVPLEAGAERIAAAFELPSAPAVTVSAGAFGQQIARESAAAGRRSAAWSRRVASGARDLAVRRQELADSIVEDTRATAETLALRHGWRLVWRGQAGATDITSDAARWLRSYWGE